MTSPSDVVAVPATSINQTEGIVSPSPLSAYFKECLATVGPEATLQLLLELYRRDSMTKVTQATSRDPLEPYAHEAVGTGYTAEFLI